MSQPRSVSLAAIAGSLAAVAGGARADDRRPRPPVRLELDACLDADHDAIRRAVRVELGDAPPAEDAAPAVVVQVSCAAEGGDDGVILDVHPPDSARHYRYALHWRVQPPDARPRLLGLAVAEAVDASRIELTAVPESPPPPMVGPVRTVAAPSAPSPWTLSVVGGQRSFTTGTAGATGTAGGGVTLLGVGLMPGRRLSPHAWFAADVTAEGSTVLVRSGASRVLSLSSAPRVLYRRGGRVYVELGAGVRVGVVRLTGEALPGTPLVSHQFTRAWFGPAASAAVGVELTPRVALTAGVELGVVGAGVTASDFGQPVVALDGRWTSVELAAAIAL